MSNSENNNCCFLKYGIRDFKGQGDRVILGMRVNPSWRAKDSPGLQANFTGRVTLQPGTT